jgi:tetratricopeptide (TPR) repeat protein
VTETSAKRRRRRSPRRWIEERSVNYLLREDPSSLPAIGRNAVYWLQRLLGPNNSRALGAMQRQIDYLRKVGNSEEAVILARSLLARCSRIFGDSDGRTLYVELQLANNLARLGRFDEAEPHLIHVLTTLGDASEIATAIDAANWHGICLVELGLPEESEPFLRRSIDGYRRLIGEDEEQTLIAQTHLARAHILQGKYEDALSIQREVLEVNARVHGPDSTPAQHARLQLAMWLHWAGEDDEALNLVSPLAASCIDADDARIAGELYRSLSDN